MNKIILFVFIVLLSLVFLLGYLIFLEVNQKWDRIFLVDLTLFKLARTNDQQIYFPFWEETRTQLTVEKKDFLEINLFEMKVKFYEQGEIKIEVPILARGNPRSWGSTAVGLYALESKHEDAFSFGATAYMPWAMGFYGKYYLHGEPYYPNGQLIVSSTSGGCIRLLNVNAKKIFKTVNPGLPVLVVDKPKDDYQYPEIEPGQLNNVSAKSYLVADLDSGFVLTQKNLREELSIASLTKLMTALVVAENVDLQRSIKVKEEMIEVYGQTEGLEAGRRFMPIELFYPLLIESSNDAAEVLAGFLGREKTIETMNQKTRSILMNQTRFVDPHGYDPANVSTSQDLFYLARYIFNNQPLFLEISKGKWVPSYSRIDFDIPSLWNKNIFINDPTFVGGKTGYTEESASTGLFIFSLAIDEAVSRNVVIIVLGSNGVERDTQRIYQWLLDNYFLGQKKTIEAR